jgi:putative membrane protein
MRWAVQQTGKVPYGEDSRKYRRTVYTHRDWLTHRSPERLFGNLQSTVSSGIVRSLLTEVAIVTLVASITVLWNTVGVLGWMDLTGTMHAPLFGAAYSSILLLSLPALPFTLSASALGLLLVFRTNASCNCRAF